LKNIKVYALFFVSFLIGFIQSTRQSNRISAIEICELVREHYYRADEPAFADRFKKCQAEAERQSLISNYFSIPSPLLQSPWSQDQSVLSLNRVLDNFQTSHLSIYSPSENQEVWSHETLDNGVRARRVEDQIIVTKVLPKSPADLAGIKVGDQIDEVDGREPNSVQQLSSADGIIRVTRFSSQNSYQKYSSTPLEFSLLPVSIQEDRSPHLKVISNDIAVLEISSFLPQYFDTNTWREMISNMARYSALVIDLRDNRGGSFPAMLRALSAFRCQAQEVGTLRRSAVDKEPGSMELKDILDTDAQLAVIDAQTISRLRTFHGYSCITADIILLIDGGTASVSELFAAAFLNRPRTQVYGQSTAGQLVMAQWFPLFARFGYTLSIPIATVWTEQKIEIEGRGIYPQKDLFYSLDQARLGVDSWLVESVAALRSQRLKSKSLKSKAKGR
jgi:C-terminal processing protease CtpA/Prc